MVTRPEACNHPDMHRRKLQTGLRRITWLIAGLALIELLLQLTLEPSKLYSRFHTAPQWNEWRNQVRFWEKNKAFDPSQLALSIAYDPVLGWDFDQHGDRIRGEQVVSQVPHKDKLRVVALGDSYVFGIDLREEDTFASLLMQRNPKLDVLNMGIPGYGIDQAVLKYLRYGVKWQPDVIVLGIYLTDYERAALSFTFGAKPRYQITDTGYRVENRPLAKPNAVVAQVESAMQHRIYLVEAARNLSRKLTHSKAKEAAFFQQNDKRVRGILEILQQQLSPDQQLVVLHFPAAEQFDNPSSYRAQLHQRLLAIYQSLNLDYIDLKTVFEAEMPPEDVYRQLYVQKGGGSVGHLNREAQLRIAYQLDSRIRSQETP